MLLKSADEQGELIAQISPKLDKGQVSFGVRGACVVLADAITQQKKLFIKGMEGAVENIMQEERAKDEGS